MSDTQTPETRTPKQIVRDNVRTMVRGVYDEQKLRIQMGNRIASNFRHKLGLESSEKEESNPDAAKVLDTLRWHHKLIADGIAAKSKAKAREPQVTPRNFKPSEDGIISTFTEWNLINQYLEMEAMEQKHFRQLEKVLRDHSIYVNYLKGVKGIGPAMAGVIISEIDIEKAHTVSALHKYAGVDTVNHWELIESPNNHEAFPELLDYIERRNKKTLEFEHQFEHGTPVEWEHKTQDGKHTCEVKLQLDDGSFAVATYLNICKGGRSRRAEHLVDVAYTDAEGNEKVRKSITFNPWLKTKLLGVLGSSFLRAGVENNPYREHYDTYKERITQREAGKPEEERFSKGRIHNMANRFMIKQFLQDLYIVWRAQEGLKVTPPYQQGKIFGGKQMKRAA